MVVNGHWLLCVLEEDRYCFYLILDDYYELTKKLHQIPENPKLMVG